MQTTPTFTIPLTTLALPGIQEPKAAPDTPVPATAGSSTGATGTVAPGTAPTGQQPQDPCGGQMMFMIPAMLALMYFMVLRPEQKRKKEQQTLLSSVKQGDRVVTLGGMHGTVVRLTEKTVVLRVDAVNMTFDRVAIARVERDDPAATDSPKS